MIRRIFIERLTTLLTALAVAPSTILAYGKNQLRIRKDGRESVVPFIEKDKQIYISLVDFAQSGNYGFFTNEERRKTVLYVGRDKVKFTANNSFIVLNNQLVQILWEPFWKDGEIWVPVSVLAELFSEQTVHAMQFDPKTKTLNIGTKNVNISQIQISAKENGTLIHIFSSKTFSKKDIALKQVHDWLYVEIYGGKADAAILNKKHLKGLISEIQVVPFAQSVSLAFKLRKKLSSRQLVFQPDSPDIYLTLRTEEPLTQQDSETKRLEEQKKDWRIHTIVLDPGHGGKDPGAIGYRKVREKDIVLPVALKLGKEINERLPDVKVIYTRKTDVFIPLWKRTKIANENNGKLFISLHCNANRNKKVRGFETYFLSAEKDAKARNVVLKENESVSFESSTDQKRYQGVNFVLATLAQNAFIKYSQYFATVVQKSLTSKMRSVDMKSRGVKQGPFWVMVGATMPNILVEMGFISNKYEAKQLQRKSTQTKLASAICDGIVKYKTDIESAM